MPVLEALNYQYRWRYGRHSQYHTCCTDTSRDRNQSEIKRSSCKIGDDQVIKTSVCAAQIKVSSFDSTHTPPTPGWQLRVSAAADLFPRNISRRNKSAMTPPRDLPWHAPRASLTKSLRTILRLSTISLSSPYYTRAVDSYAPRNQRSYPKSQTEHLETIYHKRKQTIVNLNVAW